MKLIHRNTAPYNLRPKNSHSHKCTLCLSHQPKPNQAVFVKPPKFLLKKLPMSLDYESVYEYLPQMYESLTTTPIKELETLDFNTVLNHLEPDNGPKVWFCLTKKYKEFVFPVSRYKLCESFPFVRKDNQNHLWYHRYVSLTTENLSVKIWSKHTPVGETPCILFEFCPNYLETNLDADTDDDDESEKEQEQMDLNSVNYEKKTYQRLNRFSRNSRRRRLRPTQRYFSNSPDRFGSDSHQRISSELLVEQVNPFIYESQTLDVSLENTNDDPMDTTLIVSKPTNQVLQSSVNNLSLNEFLTSPPSSPVLDNDGEKECLETLRNDSISEEDSTLIQEEQQVIVTTNTPSKKLNKPLCCQPRRKKNIERYSTLAKRLKKDDMYPVEAFLPIIDNFYTQRFLRGTIPSDIPRNVIGRFSIGLYTKETSRSEWKLDNFDPICIGKPRKCRLEFSGLRKSVYLSLRTPNSEDIIFKKPTAVNYKYAHSNTKEMIILSENRNTCVKEFYLAPVKSNVKLVVMLYMSNQPIETRFGEHNRYDSSKETLLYAWDIITRSSGYELYPEAKENSTKNVTPLLFLITEENGTLGLQKYTPS